MNLLSRTLAQQIKRSYTTATLHPEPVLSIPPFSIMSTPATCPLRPRKTRIALPAVLMRAGTSKGLFIHRRDLPEDQAKWKEPLLAAMGSQTPDPKQMDGVGGATSTTSKVAVVSPSSIPGVDVDYTFAQVGVGSQSVDFSGNCGNMASGVGPFALQEGLVRPLPGQMMMKVRIFNTNTSRYLEETLEVDEHGDFQEIGTYVIPGVKGTGSEVQVSFVEPSGSMTSKLFPTGNRTDVIETNFGREGFEAFRVRATLIDVANPFIFIDAGSLPPFMRNLSPDKAILLDAIESIRRTGAVMMGLAPNNSTAATTRGTPKIALLSYAPDIDPNDQIDHIRVQSFSMGKPHPSLQLTGAACLASAVCIEGTVAQQIQSDADINRTLPSPARTPSPVAADEMSKADISTMHANSFEIEDRKVSITHGSGSILVGVTFSRTIEQIEILKCTVSRTARRLFQGQVLCYY